MILERANVPDQTSRRCHIPWRLHELELTKKPYKYVRRNAAAQNVSFTMLARASRSLLPRSLAQLRPSIQPAKRSYHQVHLPCMIGRLRPAALARLHKVCLGRASTHEPHVSSTHGPHAARAPQPQPVCVVCPRMSAPGFASLRCSPRFAAAAGAISRLFNDIVPKANPVKHAGSDGNE